MSISAQGACIPCPAGYFQPETNKETCLDCPLGKYQQNKESAFCRGCNDPDAMSRESTTVRPASISADECLCNAGFYNGDAGPKSGLKDGCLVCPKGGGCEEQGAALNTMKSSKGSWRATGTTSVFHMCDPLLPGICNGSPVGDFDRDSQCKPGYTGLRCEVCDYASGYVKKMGGDCATCADNEGMLALVSIIGVLALPFALGYWLHAKGKWNGVVSAVTERSMKLRILLSFTQVCTRLKASFRIVLPAAVIQVFRALSWFEFFDVFTLTASMECLQVNDLIDSIWLQSLGALVLLVGLFVLSRVDPSVARRRAWMDLVLGFSFLIYPSMTATLFSFFDCRPFEDKKSYLLPDPSIDCDSERYNSSRSFVGLMVLIFVAGIPLLYLALLRPVRHIINPKPPTKLRGDQEAVRRWQAAKLQVLNDRHHPPTEIAGDKKTMKLWQDEQIKATGKATWELEERALQLGFLYRAYIPSMWYFEIAEMFRKFALTGLPMLTRLVTTESSHIELVYGIMFVFISSLVYAGTPPYIFKADQFLMLPTQFVLTLTLSGGSLLSYQNDSDTENVVSAVIISCCIGIVMVLLFAVALPRRINEYLGNLKPRLLAQLRPKLEYCLRKQGLEWADIVPVLEEVDSLEELKAAIAEPAAFLKRLAEAAGPAAKKMAIMRLKPALEPHLRKQGLEWADAVLVLEEVDSVEELKAAMAEPIALFERLTEDAEVARSNGSSDGNKAATLKLGNIESWLERKTTSAEALGEQVEAEVVEAIEREKTQRRLKIGLASAPAVTPSASSSLASVSAVTSPSVTSPSVFMSSAPMAAKVSGSKVHPGPYTPSGDESDGEGEDVVPDVEVAARAAQNVSKAAVDAAIARRRARREARKQRRAGSEDITATPQAMPAGPDAVNAAIQWRRSKPGFRQ
jgi:hypothetical protein